LITKEKSMAEETMVKEFVEKVMAFEAEKKELAEAEKELYVDYKDKLDVKAFKVALRIAKMRSKLDSDSENEVDSMLNVMVTKV
tara:strand:+ start:243 stop:494 length:252 start_codon:yes stop_codon:yes gene_type:complete